MFLFCRILKQNSHRNLGKKQRTMVIRRGVMSKVQTRLATKLTVGNNRANKRLIPKMGTFMWERVEAKLQIAIVLRKEYSFLNHLGS